MAVGIFVADGSHLSLRFAGVDCRSSFFPALLLYKMPTHDDTWPAWVLISATSLLIIAKHHENIRRLLAGTESRVGATRMSEIAIIGAGAWGTALSIVLGAPADSPGSALGARKRSLREHRATARKRKVSSRPEIPICVTPCNDLAEALEGAAIVVSVMPSQHCRLLFEQMRPHLRAGNTDRQRNERFGRKLPVADDRSDRASNQSQRR